MMLEKSQSKMLLGKTILITGGTEGIGKQAAAELAKRGAQIIIIGRNQQKIENTINEIVDQTGKEVDSFTADLSSVVQVDILSNHILDKYSRLDVLINNAGALFLRRKETADGYERTFALNHLAYFHLTNRLLDLMKTTPVSRIINVSSAAHYNGQIIFDDVMLRRRYWGMKAYSQSKLANVMFTYALSRRLVGSGVTVNALHPGFVRTKFAWDNGLIIKLLHPLIFSSAISVEQGAETMIYLASSDKVANESGKYYTRSKPRRSSDLSYDEEGQERLWKISEDLIAAALTNNRSDSV